MRVAMISYNTFARGQSNGLKENGENGVLLLQNTTGAAWGTSQASFSDGGEEQRWRDETSAIVDPLWETLKEALPTIDAVVMYVGSYGAERVIELAAQNGLTPDRAVFVMCECNRSKKRHLISSSGFGGSRVVECECGGHLTMLGIYESVLGEGRL